MKFIVIGCGSIGEMHTKNLLSLGQEVFVYDKDLVRIQNLVNRYKVQTYDFKSHHIPIDAFVICTPPNSHIPLAFEGLEHNAHLFIEKPISHTLDEVDEVIALAKEQDKVIQIGYQFRFHPGLKLVKQLLDEGKIGKLLSIRAEFGQYLPDWHPQEDYRNLYACYEEQGGGIILDGSHEIDYVVWLVGDEVSEVSCLAGKLSNLEVNTEDIAEINLKFRNGVISNIHTDFIQRTYTRGCKLYGERGAIMWMPYEDYLYLFTPKQKNIKIKPKIDMYIEEMRNFIACIEGKEKPVVDGETGKRVLEIALAAKESAKVGEVVKI